MSKKEKNQNTITSENVMTILDAVYDKVLNGIPKVSKPVSQLAAEYTKQYHDKETAAKKLINNQIAKCTTSGFITGLGGLITLPVTLPVNVTSVMYVQMRMIAAVAQIGGLNIESDQVQTLVYACLTGQAITDIVKQAGIKVGEKFAVKAIEKIPGKVLLKINQKIGFRFVTKFGTKGIVNIVKLVPFAGGIIGGAIDLVSTEIIAQNAYNLFIRNFIPLDDDTSDDESSIFETEFEDVTSLEQYEIINENICDDSDSGKEVLNSNTEDNNA